MLLCLDICLRSKPTISRRLPWAILFRSSCWARLAILPPIPRTLNPFSSHDLKVRPFLDYDWLNRHRSPNCLCMCCLDWGLGSRRPGLSPMIGEGIFTQDGPAWKHSRELLRRQFVRIQYQDVKVFDGPVNELLAGLFASIGVVDLQPFFFRFTLATTTSLIFGEPFAGLDHLDHEIFGENFDYCSLISAMRLRLADWCWLYNP